MQLTLLCFLACLVATLTMHTSCDNDGDCYPEELKAQNTVRTMDCPGLCGCDGSDYCNACIAAHNWIKTTNPRFAGSTVSLPLSACRNLKTPAWQNKQVHSPVTQP